MNKLRTGSELAMNKFLFKLLKQIELLNVFNRGFNRLSSGLDLTDFGWLVAGGCVRCDQGFTQPSWGLGLG